MEERPIKAIFQITQWYGVWPKDLKKMRSPSHLIKAIFVLITFCPISLGCGMHIIHSLYAEPKYIISEIINALAVMTSGCGMYLVIIIFIYEGEKVIKVLDRIMNFEKFGKPADIDRINRNLNRFVVFSWYYSLVGSSLFVLFGYLDKEKCEKLAAAHGVESNCGFMAPVWMPFYIKSGRNFWIYLFVQYVTCALISNLAMAIMGAAFSIVELFVRKIDHFNTLVGQAFRDGSKEEVRNYFKFCVEYHQEILQTANELNDAFGAIFLMELFYSSIVIGLIGFQCMISLQLNNAMHLIGWLIVLFSFCLAGQRLINVSEEIPMHIYSTKWYDHDVKEQKDIILCIMRSNQCLMLKPPAFNNMSMMTFSSVIKTAYSFLAMINQTTDFKSPIPTASHLNETILQAENY